MPIAKKRADLISRLEDARALLDEAIGLAKGGTNAAGAQSGKPQHTSKKALAKESANLDFTMPIRAFAKRYAGNLTGPKKFTLLVAYLSNGDSSARIERATIEHSWSKLTGILGAFNPAHTSRARENDWVDTEKTGSYYLRPRWREALE